MNTIKHKGDMLSEDRGMTPARRKMIQEHRRKADLYGPNLPYEIGVFKPKFGNKPREVAVTCDKCGRDIYVTKITCMVQCTCGELCRCNE